MYKLYFKQALEMLKQNKFISLISILGTALAIMMIMAVIVSDEIKSINVSPEINRSRMMYISRQIERDTVNQGMSSSAVSSQIIQDYLSDLKTPEIVAVANQTMFIQPSLVGKLGGLEIMDAKLRRTDAAYWKAFSFNFMEGRPYGQEEFEAGAKDAVITETLARKLFKGEPAIGQMIEVDLAAYRVAGVVEEVSPVFKMAHGDIWVPYSSQKKFEGRGYTVLLIARDRNDFPAIMEEIRQQEKKYDSSAREGWVLTLRGPETHDMFSKEMWGNSNEQLADNLKMLNMRWFFILLILLLVPAINLSGLSFSRIKKRTAEVGVRKAFGAKKHTILIQVLMENLITSLLGGIIGLLLSYLAVYQMRHWLLNIPADSYIAVNTLISFPVILAVFTICVLINLLSAGLPAYRASRMTIVNSLTQNDKNV